MNIQKNIVLRLAGLTIIGMPFVAYLIDSFSESVGLADRLIQGEPFIWQVGVGLLAGLISAVIAAWISRRAFMKAVSFRYNSMISSLNLNTSEIIFISFCAGFGEEILFRGAIQPLLGIAITAVLFVALHGYLSFRDWRISVYGLFMTAVIAVLGYLTETVGIWSAVMAHTVIDIVLLLMSPKDDIPVEFADETNEEE